jgi:hypothetical protein
VSIAVGFEQRPSHLKLRFEKDSRTIDNQIAGASLVIVAFLPPHPRPPA